MPGLAPLQLILTSHLNTEAQQWVPPRHPHRSAVWGPDEIRKEGAFVSDRGLDHSGGGGQDQGGYILSPVRCSPLSHPTSPPNTLLTSGESLQIVNVSMKHTQLPLDSLTSFLSLYLRKRKQHYSKHELVIKCPMARPIHLAYISVCKQIPHITHYHLQ